MGTRKSGFRKVLIFAGIIFILFAISSMAYGLWLRPEIEKLYVGEGHPFLQNLLDWLYPRFSTEKVRLPLDFFLRKADQILLRMGLVFVAISLLGLAFGLRPTLSSRWRAYWNQEISLAQARYLHILLGLVVVYVSRDWLQDLFAYSLLSDFFYPSFLIRILGWGFPPAEILFLAYGCMLSCLWLSYWQDHAETYLLGFVLIFVILQAYLFSFHKLDHTFAPLNSILFAFPILIYYKKQASANQTLTLPAWPLLWMRCMVAAAYFLAGTEKLLVSGLAWFYPESLAAFLGQHPSDWGLWLARQPLLSTTISILVVLFELSFVAILWFPRFAGIFLAGACLFHWSIYWFMDIGAWLHYWILSYFIFISWDKLSQAWQIRLRPK